MKPTITQPIMWFTGAHGGILRPSYILEDRLAIRFDSNFALRFANFWPLQN